MCEHDDMDEFARRSSDLTRRQFGAMALGAGFVAAFPKLANAAETKGTDVEIKTADGVRASSEGQVSRRAHLARYFRITSDF
jgi:carboxymethylenebutenolidase